MIAAFCDLPDEISSISDCSRMNQEKGKRSVISGGE